MLPGRGSSTACFAGSCRVIREKRLLLLTFADCFNIWTAVRISFSARGARGERSASGYAGAAPASRHIRSEDPIRRAKLLGSCLVITRLHACLKLFIHSPDEFSSFQGPD